MRNAALFLVAVVLFAIVLGSFRAWETARLARALEHSSAAIHSLLATDDLPDMPVDENGISLTIR